VTRRPRHFRLRRHRTSSSALGLGVRGEALGLAGMLRLTVRGARLPEQQANAVEREARLSGRILPHLIDRP
jgi:hypothetical protein